MSKKLKGSLILLLAAIIWGSAFVAQDKGVEFVGPFTFNAVRWIVGVLFLFPIILIKEKRENKAPLKISRIFSKNELIGGSVLGILLFVSSSLQQFGISLYESGEAAAGKSGFITALYIILVPVFGIFMKKRVQISVWISIAIALVGMYLLCIKSGFKLSTPDLLVFLCAIAFTFHILTVDAFSKITDGLKFSVIQMLVCFVFSAICMFVFETPTLHNILKAALPLLYAGVLSSGVAYTLQIIGQKEVNPTVASVLMSLESVFAAITGAVFGERMSQREALGGALMFIAVILAQIDFTAIKNKPKK